MSSTQDSQNRTLRAKKAAAPNHASPATLGNSGPTTFFLRSEKDIEKDTQRGRRISRESTSTVETSHQNTPMESMTNGESFGVQSLEDTIGATTGALSSDDTLSRTDSNLSEASVEAGADANANLAAGRKRKAGNPVHPRILATGQRIISGEHNTQASPSPVSQRSAESPFRNNGRRGSLSSSANLSQPLTPLRMSPRTQSAMPSTPRSGSPKSFRLSDEEQSLASDTGSQAVQSSSGDEQEEGATASDEKAESLPQLVMPSIAIPTRRPFTERGRHMGRLKVMVVGPKGVGKTSLIRSICRVCEDVVHLDSPNGSISTSNTDNNRRLAERGIVEVGASTRPYPSWWTDFESRRQLLRRKSIGEGVLERNLTFVDTTGFDDDNGVRPILEHFTDTLSRMGNMARMHDSELINMLSGEGGVQVDLVLYFFEPAAESTESPAQQASPNETQSELLRYLCKWSNVIPLIARSDTIKAENLTSRKAELLDMFKALNAEPCLLHRSCDSNDDGDESTEATGQPYAVSSALGDDPETIEASILMSSGYLQPLVASELETFVGQLLEPENMARLRHLSATKFLLWRQENLSSHLDLQRQTLRSKFPVFEPSSPAITNTGSMLDDPSKVLVPHGSSSYFRSISPSGASESSVLSGGNNDNENIMATSAQALARYNDQTKGSEPFRQIRLAKWAQDLQRSLDNERKRYAHIFTMRSPPSDGQGSNTNDSDSEKAVIATTQNDNDDFRPSKGRLGGDLGIIDPRDPLGLLAFTQVFKRRGYFALQIAGSCGLLGAAMWWLARNWADVQEYLGLGTMGQPMITMAAVPAPTRGWWGLGDVGEWRNFLGMER